MHFDRRGVSVYRHHVVGQITVDRRAALRIVRGVLQQRHADSHHHRALDLVPAGQRINDAAPIHDRHNPADTQPGDLRLPGNLNEVAAERVRRILGLGIAEEGLRFAAARDQTKVGTAEQIIERHTLGGAISLLKDLAPFECQICGKAVLERRAGRNRCDCEQRCDCVVGRREDSRDHRFGRQRAARQRAFRQHRVAERYLDLFERHAGLLRGELRENGVHAGADVLRSTRNAGRAVIAELHARCGRESSGDPRTASHPPAQRQAVALHGANFRRAPGPAELLRAEL